MTPRDDRLPVRLASGYRAHRVFDAARKGARYGWRISGPGVNEIIFEDENFHAKLAPHALAPHIDAADNLRPVRDAEGKTIAVVRRT